MKFYPLSVVSRFLLNPNVSESGLHGFTWGCQTLIRTLERVICGWAGSRGSPGSVAVQTPSLLEVRVMIMCLFSVTGNRLSMMANKCFETEKDKGELGLNGFIISFRCFKNFTCTTEHQVPPKNRRDHPEMRIHQNSEI